MALGLVAGEPKGEKEDGAELGEFGGLTGDAMKFQPAPGAIDLVPEGRKKTEGETNERKGKPNPPGAFPEMVVDQRRDRAGDETDSEP